MTIHYSKDMSCPFCGNDEFYVKQCYRGKCEFNYKFNGELAYNGEMYDFAQFKTTSTYAYCNNCNKRLFKLSELPFDV